MNAATWPPTEARRATEESLHFGAVLDGLCCGDGACFAAEVPEAWAQGRAVYGGLLAALGYRAARRLIGADERGPEAPPERAARAVLTSFIGPVAPGRVEVETRLLRSGRAVTQVLATLSQEGDALALVQVVFGAARESAALVAGPPRPPAPAPESVPPLPFVAGLTPAFTRFFDYRPTQGRLPFTGAAEALLGGHFRLRDVGASLDAVELALALGDAWPAPVLPLLRRPAPASSLTWSLELVAPPAGAERPDPAGYWFFEARADASAEGYAQEGARLWRPDGSLAAASRQLVAVFG